MSPLKSFIHNVLPVHNEINVVGDQRDYLLHCPRFQTIFPVKTPV